jgi:hypothetical protein
MVFASAMGPVFFSLGQLITGSYIEVILLSGFIPLALAVAALNVSNPQDHI